jgi:hypothetical protein
VLSNEAGPNSLGDHFIIFDKKDSHGC